MTSQRPALGRTSLDLVEYYPPGMMSGPLTRKADQVYHGAGPRASDGMHCLSVMSPGSSRRHNIEVGSIVAITLSGKRYELEVPPDRYRLRSQEIIRLVEGDFSEEWPRPYFDHASPKYYRSSLSEERNGADRLGEQLPFDALLRSPVQPASFGKPSLLLLVIAALVIFVILVLR